jgi:predicted MPP superfamily phosphohydrolase
LKRFLTGVALGAAAALAVDAFLIEPASPAAREEELPVRDLPAAWEGARVAHLTDLHWGNPRSEALFAWMVRTVNAWEPDLILITGDFITEEEKEVPPCARWLRQLRSQHGIVAVFGDHDYHRSDHRLIRGIQPALEAAGVRFLRNAALELPGGLRLAGVDPETPHIRECDLGLALRDLNGQGPHLLLSHSPDVLPEAAGRGVALILCGHTHGGQVVLPFYGPPITHTRVSHRHASGWSSQGTTRVFTGRGLSSHHSLRFLCRPEIALFTLRRAERC